jgi:hypothetical protein
MPRRKLLDKPTPNMRDKAILALAAVVDDPNSPTHARVTAARAIYGPPEREEDPAERTSPPVLMCLPSNGRDRGLEKIGLTWNGATADIRYLSTPEGIADRDRWIAEYHARVAKDWPDEPLVPIRARQPAKLLAPPLIEASQEKRRLPLP